MGDLVVQLPCCLAVGETVLFVQHLDIFQPNIPAYQCC